MLLLTKTINICMIIFAFVFPISLGAANAILGIMLLLWIIEGNYKQKFMLLKHIKIVWIFLGIGLLTLFSAFLSHSMHHSFLAGEHKSLLRVIFSHYLLLPMILVLFITSIQKKYLDTIITAFLSAIFVSEISSYLIYFQQVDISWLKAKHLVYHLTNVNNPTPFMHHTEYSVFLSIASIFLMHKVLHTKSMFIKVFMALFLISATTNLFLNGGRTGQISYILAMFTYLFFHFRFSFKSFFGTLIALFILLFSAYHFSPNFHNRSLTALQNIEQVIEGNYDTSWGLRVAAIKVTLNYLSSTPSRFLLGAGVGDSRNVFLTHAKQNFNANISEPIKILSHLHNQYLEYWMDGSILSLILFICFFIVLLRRKVLSEQKALLYAFVVILLFSSSTDVPFFRYQPAMLFFLISGYFFALPKNEKGSK